MVRVVVPFGKHYIDDKGRLNCDRTRSFIVFGEEVSFFIESEDDLNTAFHSLQIILNETILTIDKSSHTVIQHNSKLWEVLMAPLHDRLFDPCSLTNQTSARSELLLECKYNSGNYDVAERKEKQDKNYLQSYELLQDDVNQETLKGRRTTMEMKIEKITFPVYSIISMRLRNIALPNINFEATENIISSVDIQLARLFSDIFPQDNEVIVETLSYELHDGHFSVTLQSMDDMIQFPLVLSKRDSYTFNYALERNLRNVSVSIAFYIPNKMKVYTKWRTEVSLKKSKQSNAILRSNNSTPNFLQIPKNPLPRVLFLAQFNFINTRLTVKKGEIFTLILQIENTTSRKLNLVLYHRPKTSLAETVILLTNDSKIPLLDPGDTIHYRLELIAIAVGYHRHLKGIKIVDLDASDVIDVGYSVSLLVE